MVEDALKELWAKAFNKQFIIIKHSKQPETALLDWFKKNLWHAHKMVAKQTYKSLILENYFIV